MSEFIGIESPAANGKLAKAVLTESPSVVLWLQAITLVWMAIECGVALFAASAAHSPAALAFGSDSLVELLSAVLVLMQFIPLISLHGKELNRISAGLLFALAGIITVIATVALVRQSSPEASLSGIGITVAALLIMPLLAGLKRRHALRSHNSVLAADATQSATCAYLAAATLVGLAANALFRIAWLDPVAALFAVPLLIREGIRTWRGVVCNCCS